MREVGAGRHFVEWVLPWWVHRGRASGGLVRKVARGRAGRGGSCRGGGLAGRRWQTGGCAAW
eukprot:7374047-Heterocapsa_arctica.AAC.1